MLAVISRHDPGKVSPARRYNYWLGGHDNYAVDRASGDLIAEKHPNVVIGARENRSFMLRAAARLTRLGIRQFLDIGCGIPLSPELHDVVQEIAPESRVVYVDNDELVMSHTRALRTSGPLGRVDYVAADFRDPQSIIDAPELRRTLDLAKPVALFVVALLHFFRDVDEPFGNFAQLVDALPSGSCIVLSHGDETLWNAVEEAEKDSPGHGPFQPRDRQQIADFLIGLKVLMPGVTSVVDWLPGEHPMPNAAAREACMYGVIATKS
jgi:hypothetical protein